MVATIEQIPDFPGMPGQRPTPGAPTAVEPIAVVLVTTQLDATGSSTPLNRAAVDAFIAAEIAADRALVRTVERWSPWSGLDLEIGFAPASRFNYGRFTVGGVNFYGYVSADYQTLTTTSFTVIPDDWTTYNASIGYSYVRRSHVAVAASMDDTYGDLYCTAPEPIDASPVRGVLSADVLSSQPDDWTVMVISANDLRGGTGNPFWDRHIQADLIEGAARKASAATVNSEGVVQATIPDAQYPWAIGGSGSSGEPAVVDTISPGHVVTNPGYTIPAGWAWHIANNGGRGGVDFNYIFEEFTAPAAGMVDHFDVPGVGMVVRLILDEPAPRTSARFPNGDAQGPMRAIWFQHCSASVDGHAEVGDVIGTSGNGGGLYGAHLHVHGMTDTGDVAGTNNRCNMFGFIGGEPGTGPDVYVPKVTGSPVSTIDGVAAGGGVYLFTPAGWAQYETIMQGAPWVTSGIIDTRLVPSWAIGSGNPATFTPAKSSTDPAASIWPEAAVIPKFVGEVVSAQLSTTVLSSWRTTALATVGAEGWRKLLTSQFTEIMVGNGDGPRSFSPELWKTPSIAFQAVTGAAHGEASLRIIPAGYNELGSQMGVETPIGGQAGLTHSGYGLAGANTASQDLTPYLNAFSSQLSWAVALRNKALAQTLGYTQVQLSAGTQGVSTVMGAVQSAAGGALVGGGAGAIAGAAMGGVGAIGSMATAGIQAQNSITMLDASQDGSFDITAMSLGLSGEAAVATFDTWKQSLSAVSGGGSAHRMASAWRAILGQTFDVIIAMPSADAVARLISTWRRYGYMVERAFVPPRLDAMTKYTYWQLDEPTIIGAMPAEARARLVERFSRGTTVWTNVAEIGTEPTNAPRSGVSY